MQTYINAGAGPIEVDPDGKDNQVIFNKDAVEVVANAGGPLKAGVIFTVTSEGAMQTKTFDIFFQDKPGAGAIGFSDEAVVAILYHRMRLKHAETGNDEWLTAAKYLEDVEESIQAAMRGDREVVSGQAQ